MITVFTPLYNREKTILKVYNSLCAQTDKNFEWLVINDGSTDSSGEIMDTIIKNHSDAFRIRYYKKENEGLNRTLNRCIDLVEEGLLFRLDSDDYALANAIELIRCNKKFIEENPNICSIVFLSLKNNGEINGYHPFTKTVTCNFKAYRDRYRAVGDRAEVTDVTILKKYRYPEFEGEKFCPESVVWYRMAAHYDAVYINEAIYKKGEQDDSITANIYNHLKNNCQGTVLHYKEIIEDSSFSFRYRLISAIKYYRYAIYAKKTLLPNIPIILLLISFPAGMIITLVDNIRYK